MTSRCRGFSVVELALVAFLGTMLGLALLLTITSSAYAQTRTDRLFAADMVLTAHSEKAFRQSYDSLDGLVGEQAIEQDGFEFKLRTSVEDLENPEVEGVKRVFLLLTWEDRFGQGNRARNVLRAQTW